MRPTDRAQRLASTPDLRGATAAPEGDRIAYWWSGNDRPELRVHDVAAGTDRRVDVEGFDPGGGEPLAFHDRGLLVVSRPETYLLDPESGRADPLDDGDAHTNVQSLGPDRRRVLYLRYADPWELRGHDPATGEDWHVADHPEQFGNAGFGPGGDRIAYRHNPTDETGGGTPTLADADGNRIREFSVGDPSVGTRLRDWHPDGRRLLVTDRSTDRDRVGVHDLDAGGADWLSTGEFVERGYGFVGGDRAVALRFREGTTVGVAYDLATGRGREFDLPAGETRFPRTDPDGVALGPDRVVVAHETPARPRRLLAYDLRTGEADVLVDAAADADGDGFPPVDARYVRFDSTDGFEVGGILYASPDPDDPLPAVVVVHGGPRTRESLDFDRFARFLVGEGYAVLQPNYRGSIGRGRAFREAIVGDYGGGEVEDVVAARDWLADRAWVDADRIAVFGHSHGGYNAYCQAVDHPDRWAAAIPENGYPDLLPSYEGTGSGTVMRRFMGDPEENADLLRERSPLYHVESVDVPLLVVHGGEGPGLERVERFVDRLRATDPEEPVRFEVLDGEGHVIGDEVHLWTLVAAFLDRHCSR